MDLMNKKIISVFIGLSLLVGVGLGQEMFNENKVEAEAWSDLPMYMQNAELDITHESVVEEKVREERCVEFNETSLECLSSEMQTVPGPNVEVIKFSDTSYEYVGNGEVRISFDAKLNNKLVSSKKLKNFNREYFLNGEEPTDGEFNDFYNSLNDLTFRGSGGSQVKASKIPSNKVNAGKVNDLDFVVELEDFRSGGVKLSEFATVEVETMNGGA